MMKSVSLALMLLAGAPASAETVVVTADRMIDVLSGRLVANPVVTITDRRISAVSTGAAPAGAKVIALPGKTILPGLIDMHVHLDSSPRYGGYTGLQFTDSFWTAIGVQNARDMLVSGKRRPCCMPGIHWRTKDSGVTSDETWLPLPSSKSRSSAKSKK